MLHSCEEQHRVLLEGRRSGHLGFSLKVGEIWGILWGLWRVLRSLEAIKCENCEFLWIINGDCEEKLNFSD